MFYGEIYSDWGALNKTSGLIQTCGCFAYLNLINMPSIHEHVFTSIYTHVHTQNVHRAKCIPLRTCTVDLTHLRMGAA